MTNSPWWKGRRGEWYVIVQVGLFGLVVLGPRSTSGMPEWMSPLTQIGTVGGAILVLAGGLLVLGGVLRLGSNLTAVPYPKDEATLVETGPYQIVRHPIYSGLIVAAFGWALWVHGSLTLIYALILLVYFDVKSRREEQWLKDKFPGYGAYQKRVRKLIPFVY
jgi:protein-S-isoprenylcysteine O-methyltransferase Ste14